MPVPSRPQPRVGELARIAHFGGDYEDAVIVAVAEEGRRVSVRDERGETTEFTLSPATARFVATADAGTRLVLLEGR